MGHNYGIPPPPPQSAYTCPTCGESEYVSYWHTDTINNAEHHIFHCELCDKFYPVPIQKGV